MGEAKRRRDRGEQPRGVQREGAPKGRRGWTERQVALRLGDKEAILRLSIDGRVYARDRHGTLRRIKDKRIVGLVHAQYRRDEQDRRAARGELRPDEGRPVPPHASGGGITEGESGPAA